MGERGRPVETCGVEEREKGRGKGSGAKMREKRGAQSYITRAFSSLTASCISSNIEVCVFVSWSARSCV